MNTPHRHALKLWKGFAALIGLFIVYLLSVEFNLLFLFGNTPSLESLESPKMELASELYTADGKPLGKYYRENRSPITYNKISPYLIKALLATEDIRYYEHSGIDLQAMGSVVVSVATGDNRGGSTITQQLAKNLYKIRRGNSRGLLGKIPGIATVVAKTKEWLTAVKLEHAYTKEEILTMYMNTVDFGSNSYGIKTAAKTFFNTSPDSLSLEEAATLIGMLKATTYYNPKRNYKNALRRRNTVLGQMVKYNLLEQKVYDSLTNLPIVLDYQEPVHADGVLDYYNGYLTAFLNEWAEEKGYDIYADGLKIYTTIDSRMQQHANKAMQEHMRILQDRFYKHWQGRNPWVDENGVEIPGFIETMIKRTDTYKSLKRKYGNNEDSIQYWLNQPKRMVVFNWSKPFGDTLWMSSLDSLRYYKKILHAGLMTMDPFTGHIKAWAGGINFDFFKYDHVKQSRRQPGSTFKAFVYAAAMDRGYSPCYKVVDKPVTINYEEEENGVMVQKAWSPGNAAGRFSGSSMTLRYALGRSINSVAAQMTEKLGPETVAEYAKKLGISSPLKAIPSIGLGSNDVTLYEMVGAYSAFVNQGIWTEPMIVTRIEDHSGNVIHQFVPKSQKAITPEAAFLMIHMLKGTLQEPGGTAQALFSYQIFRNNEMAGKTGTSSNQSDGWFIGLTKDLVTGVWVGAEERSIHFRTLPTGEGSKTALPIYGRYMEKVYADQTLGINEGFFPKPTVKITQKYLCPTRLVVKDTTKKDTVKLVPAAAPNPNPSTLINSD